MIDVLEGIWNAVTNFGQLVLWAVVSCVNLVITAVGGLMAWVFGLFPSFPERPTFTGQTWVAWLNWFFPIAEFIAIALTFVTLWLGFMALRVVAKWVKAL